MEPNNLKKIFDKIEPEQYCVVKFNEENLGEQGTDIDLYCYDISLIGKKILYMGNDLLKEGVYEKIILTESKDWKHAYIDFWKDGLLQLRFDLMGELPQFKTVGIKKGLFNECITNRVLKKIKEDINVFVPSEPYDILVRYIEFIEYYPDREDKIRHISFVAHILDTEEKRKQFLLDVAKYIYKRRPERRKTPVLKRMIGLAKKIVRKTLNILST